MATPKATNTFVFIIRDAAEKKMGELVIPDKGKVKPHRGEIFSVGGKVTDPDIKKGVGKKGLFHQGVGFSIEVDGTEYLVLEEIQIIGIL
jgi:co-chaperonin GroES (HSP10)